MPLSTRGDPDDDTKPQPIGTLAIEDETTVEHLVAESFNDQEYKVYRRRWFGLVSLCLLNISAGMNWLWFAPISVSAAQQFDTSLTRINWLSNAVCLIYVPVSFIVPAICNRYGIRNPCISASVIIAIGAWIRYAAVANTLSPNSAYALLMIGQVSAGIAQPWFQILGPRYSELWFDLKGRTTATAIIAIANPVGCALGELISPLYKNVKHSLLTLAIITTVLSLTSIGILHAPPTPPTFAGSHDKSPSLLEVVRATFGLSDSGNSGKVDRLKLTIRQRWDVVIVTILFSVLVGAADAFFILVDQIFNPYGYSNDAAGNMGGALIVSGIIAAIVTAPLFDRVLTFHLGLVAKCIVPVLSLAWLVLIWDVRPHNYAGLYPVFVFIGVGSFILLPIALEIGVEVTSSAEASSAIFWCGANVLSVVLVEIMGALRAGDDGNPPQNMKRSVIFLGVVVMILCFFTVFGLEAKQVRKEVDTRKVAAAAARAQTRADLGATGTGEAVVGNNSAGRPRSRSRSRSSSTTPMHNRSSV